MKINTFQLHPWPFRSPVTSLLHSIITKYWHSFLKSCRTLDSGFVYLNIPVDGYHTSTAQTHNLEEYFAFRDSRATCSEIQRISWFWKATDRARWSLINSKNIKVSYFQCFLMYQNLLASMQPTNICGHYIVRELWGLNKAIEIYM